MSSMDNGLSPSTRMPKTTLEETILRIKNILHSEQMKIKKITNVKSNILD